MQAFDFVAPLLQKLPEQEAQKCATVVANICKPEQCWLDFFVPEASEAGILQEEGEEQEEAPAAILGANKLNSLKAEFNKATGTLLELLVDLMRGEYLADCRTLAKENVKLAQAVSEVAVQAVPSRRPARFIKLFLLRLCEEPLFGGPSLRHQHKECLTGSAIANA